MAVNFNINNPDSCQRAYLNYHCYGNTMNISPADMGAILAKWGDKVESWEKSATTNDSVDYEFDNSDFEKYKDQYDDDVNIGVEHGRGTLDLGVAATGIILRKTAEKTFEKSGEKVAGWALERAGNKALKKVGEKGIKKATDEAISNMSTTQLMDAGKKALGDNAATASQEQIMEAGKKSVEDSTKASIKKSGEEASKVTKESSAQSIGCIVGCTMAAITGATYWAKQPNKEEVEVVKELNEKMGTAQSNLITEQDNMAKTQEQIVAMVEEAEVKNEEANAFIAKQEAPQQFRLSTINSIKSKQASGAQLTASERALYNESVTLLQESNTAQANASAEVNDEVAAIYGDIEGKQSVYDNTADVMSDIQGMTEYAESMDTATAVSCGIEIAAQGLNVVSGYKAAGEATALASSGSWAFGATAWAWAFVVMGYAGAAASLAGGIQQASFLKETINEIGNRNNTQDLNSSTQEIYNQEVDALAGSLGYIEDLEYEIPELDDTSNMFLAADKPEEQETSPDLLKKKTEGKTV